MNPVGLTAVRPLPGHAPSLPAAPWSLSWSHQIATAPTDLNARMAKDHDLVFAFMPDCPILTP
jgi:hypothetical protein